MKNLNPSKLIGKLGSICGSFGVAIALGTSLGWSGSAEAIGFNTGSNGGIVLTRNAWGNGIGDNVPPATILRSNSANGDFTINSDTSATLFGPDNNLTNDVSYLDWYFTAAAGTELQVQFSWSFFSNDGTYGDDQAGVFKLSSSYDTNNPPANPSYLVPLVSAAFGNPGPNDPNPNNDPINPISSSEIVSVNLQENETLVFRVLTQANTGGTGDFTISDFDVQFIPFEFAPTYGVIFVGTALGINEWRKKRQARKKNETDKNV
jgi:hypothetical protein